MGDYAQMCKLSSFLELGMLALLFYYAGGCPCDCCNNNYYYHFIKNDNNNNCAPLRRKHASECGHGCGCGVEGYGKSPCYVAFLAMLCIVGSVFKTLALGDFSMIVAAGNGNFPRASNVLAKMAHIMHGFDGIDIKGGHGCVGGGGLITEMSSFLAKPGAMQDVLPILRFWEGRNRQDESADNNNDRGHQPLWCVMPQVVQLLLLKLLYSLPMSSSCL